MGLCKQVIYNFLLAIILALTNTSNQFELMFGVTLIDLHLLNSELSHIDLVLWTKF